MKAIKLSFFATAMLLSGAAVKAQTADEIMANHDKAMGGVESWNKIKTLKMTGSMSQQGMDINMTQTMVTGKGLRVDISVMGMNGFQIMTPGAGYMYMPFAGQTKVDTMKPELAKAAGAQLDIKKMQRIDYKSEGVKAELAGNDTINSAPCYKIKFTDKEGSETVCYFDMKTYYLLRTETKAKVDDQEQEASVAYNNYQKQDGGIVLPMNMTAMGGEINYKTVEVNKPVDDKIFIPAISK